MLDKSDKVKQNRDTDRVLFKIGLVKIARMAKKNPAAVELGKLGGKKGGRARMESMTAEERAEFARAGGSVGGKKRAENLSAKQRKAVAKKAAAARWGKKGAK